MSELTGIFKQIKEHTYSAENCFLCGCLLNENNRTEEHVIPKWIQKEFNLWDQKLTLLNKTLFSYRLLTIPCCFDCNNIHLKPFEDRISKAYREGFNSFKSLNKEDLFLWLGKIYFGILYKELFLNVDRANPEDGTILNEEYLKSFYNHFLFLQGIRKKHKFSDFFPASFFLFKTQKPKSKEKQWDFIDNQNKLFISIRMGEIGIISVLQDGEATQQLDYILNQHRDIELHPLQFREMTSKILYKAINMNRTPKFINIQTGEVIETVMSPLQGMSDKPIFDDWNNNEYSKVLSYLTGIPLEICQPEKGKVWTWLMDENNKSIFIDANE